MTDFRIRVPGSTANLGPGFDSIGLAVNRFLTLDVTRSDKWSFQYKQAEYANLPNDETNLLYQVMAFTLEQVGVPMDGRACELVIDSELPLARGLGSSAAAVVAGIELADRLYDLNLSLEEKARIGSLYEGHPDNIGASLYGGLTIGSHTEQETFIVPWGGLPLEMLIVVPRVQLLTSVSRGRLPETLTFRESVQASSYANVLIAALIRGDLELAGKMMKRDLFHQPYRRELVPQLEAITSFVEKKETCGIALSGAGPSVLIFLQPGRGEALLPELQAYFPDCEIESIQPEAKGLEVTYYQKK